MFFLWINMFKLTKDWLRALLHIVSIFYFFKKMRIKYQKIQNTMYGMLTLTQCLLNCFVENQANNFLSVKSADQMWTQVTVKIHHRH